MAHMISSRHFFAALASIALLLAASGCILVPAIESVSKAGLTAGDREALLPDVIKQFNESLYWGTPGKALKLVAEDYRAGFMAEYRKKDPSEHVVESKPEMFDYSDDAFSAKVDVLIKYYKVPFYVVENRRELQVWNFSLTGGWKLASKEVLSESSKTTLTR